MAIRELNELSEDFVADLMFFTAIRDAKAAYDRDPTQGSGYWHELVKAADFAPALEAMEAAKKANG